MILKFATAAVMISVATAGLAPLATADVLPGCKNDLWGFLGSQTRTICDGPRAADGSWVRFRMVWVPAQDVPIRTSCSSYSCTSTGGYFQQERVFEKVKYPVTDGTVVAGEPAWLSPTFTDAGGFTPINFN